MRKLCCECALLVSILGSTPLRPAVGQTYTCLGGTAQQAHLLYDHVVSLVPGTDSATVVTRNLYHLPAVAASKVGIVTTASVCTQAGDAYHAAITDPGTPLVSRTLVVIKVGTTRYVVLDLNEHGGPVPIAIRVRQQMEPAGVIGVVTPVCSPGGTLDCDLTALGAF